jgi:hypothetical protein
VIGVIGGYQQGDSTRSFTSVFDGDILNLYRWVTAR